MYRSGTALLIKLRNCFIKHNGKEQDSGNNAIFCYYDNVTKQDYQ